MLPPSKLVVHYLMQFMRSSASWSSDKHADIMWTFATPARCINILPRFPPACTHEQTQHLACDYLQRDAMLRSIIYTIVDIQTFRHLTAIKWCSFAHTTTLYMQWISALRCKYISAKATNAVCSIQQDKYAHYLLVYTARPRRRRRHRQQGMRNYFAKAQR